MRTLTVPAVASAVLLVLGCSDATYSPTDSLTARVDVVLSKADPMNGHTHLSGRSEVPERETSAQGQLKLQLTDDGTAVRYQLIASNIENVLQAHLHLAPAGSNGPVVVWLYPSAPPAVPIPGRHDGVLAEGEFTAASLVGPLAGESIETLIERIQQGGVYVNVHTNDFVDPPNTGAGDFPGGEIRGQVRMGG